MSGLGTMMTGSKAGTGYTADVHGLGEAGLMLIRQDRLQSASYPSSGRFDSRVSLFELPNIPAGYICIVGRASDEVLWDWRAVSCLNHLTKGRVKSARICIKARYMARMFHENVYPRNYCGQLTPNYIKPDFLFGYAFSNVVDKIHDVVKIRVYSLCIGAEGEAGLLFRSPMLAPRDHADCDQGPKGAERLKPSREILGRNFDHIPVDIRVRHQEGAGANKGANAKRTDVESVPGEEAVYAFHGGNDASRKRDALPRMIGCRRVGDTLPLTRNSGFAYCDGVDTKTVSMRLRQGRNRIKRRLTRAAPCCAVFLWSGTCVNLRVSRFPLEPVLGGARVSGRQGRRQGLCGRFQPIKRSLAMADMRVTGRRAPAESPAIPVLPIVPPPSKGRRDGRVVFWDVPTTGREDADYTIGRAMAAEAIPTFARSSGLLFAVLRDLAEHGTRGHLHGFAVALSDALAKGPAR